MRLDVKPILRNPEKRIPFQFEMDLSDMDFSGRCPICRPVLVEGEVYSSADVLHLTLTADTVLDAMCDRCGKEFTQEKKVTIARMSPVATSMTIVVPQIAFWSII